MRRSSRSLVPRVFTISMLALVAASVLHTPTAETQCPDRPEPRIYDIGGQERDWSWLQAVFGAVAREEATSCPGGALYAVDTLREKHDVSLRVTVLDRYGSRAPDVPVAFFGFGDSVDTPGACRPNAHIVSTNQEGEANVPMGWGSAYEPPAAGYHAVWVMDSVASDCVTGLGMVEYTDHWHLNVVFRQVALDAQDFTISSPSPPQTILPGESVTYTITLTAENGFNDPVMLSAMGMPAACEASFDPNPAVPTCESVLTIGCAVAPPVGSHTIVVSGEVDSLVRSAEVIVNGPHRVSTPLVLKQWPPSTPELANLWLLNNSGREICEVYFSPPSDPWGKNRLVGGTTILPGEWYLWSIPPGVYDLWARDCSGTTLSVVWFQWIYGDYYWVVPLAPEPTPTPTPVDTEGPEITEVAESNDHMDWPDAQCLYCQYPNTVTISAHITDPSGVSAAKLTYRINGAGAQWQSIPMTQVQAGTYSATIGPAELIASLNPPVPTGTCSSTSILQYYVQAFDGLDNSAQSPTGTVTVHYCYIVT